MPALAPLGPEVLVLLEQLRVAPLDQRGQFLPPGVRQVKETWPEAKNLADARRKELAALIEQGDAELFQESQTLWKKRSKERHDAWLQGNSKSAQGVKAKKES